MQSQDVQVKSNHEKSNDWKVIANLLPYLWTFKGRVILALSCLIAAKVANLGVPILLKFLVDSMSVPPGLQTLIVVPVALIIAYGLLRLSASLFTELRELIFSRVTESAVRTVALQVFEHLHALSLRFHLSRQTGGMTRDIERGTRGIQSLISYSLYSILPTMVELSLVLGYFVWAYNYSFALITLVALVLYVIFTIVVTEWRTKYRKRMNELDSKAHQRAVDALINFETVKYFGNEEYESKRYDENLHRYREAAIQSQRSLAVLNVGQQTSSHWPDFNLWQATIGVSNGSMTLGDLVLVNVLMIQLYIPLNFLGVIYREIKQALIDMDRMFKLLGTDREIADQEGAQDLVIKDQALGPHIQFHDVSFSYERNRQILKGIDFEVLPGKTTAVVGHSGAGKSTLARLLFRFYDVTKGSIEFDQQNIQAVTQKSVRACIGIVPQDTVLFNDTIAYNIAYGRPGASQEEIEIAAKAAQIHDFITSLPDGYKSAVGERGLKLSGGEKQRVAIARTLLKNPSFLIFDEATSALDSETERAIQKELMALAKNRSTLIIAHRLSTIIYADQILVMDDGCIIERGTHDELLSLGGRYSDMWQAQQSQTKLIS
jgi:ATP-binding cassette, subfamily B, heavy metal transporter